MLHEILLSPPVALGLFLLLAYGIYRLGGLLAARGEEHPDKRQPYACGEDIRPPETQLSYHAFFQLALMFAVLHLCTLVVATLPPGGASHLVAIAYLVGIAASVLVLTRGEL